MELDSRSILKLIEVAKSNENKIAYRSQSPQLIAFAAIGLVYVTRTNWSPTENLSNNTRLELRDIAYGLNIDKTAYETFIASVRRMMKKICDLCADEAAFDRIRNTLDEQEALTEFLSFLAEKNIFTAAHMRIWALTDTIAPLDLTRRSGDSARFRKGAVDPSSAINSSHDGYANETREITLVVRPSSHINSELMAIFATRNFLNDREFIKISSDFRTRAELNVEIDRLQYNLEMLRGTS